MPMKAAVHRNGSVEIADLDIPAPADDEVLVRVHASTICAADYRGAGVARVGGRILRKVYGRPIVFGMEMSGTVESTGKNVVRFRPGDLVFGASGFRFGCHAEYACAREYALEIKPANMTLEEAATIPFGALTAWCFVRWSKVEAGQNVLIYGASGSVGVWAVQLAKHLGARVTGVCSTANVEMVKSLGADKVVDYTKEDFSSEGRVYDAVIDTVGKAGFARSVRALKRGRPYARVAPSGSIPSVLWDLPRQWVDLAHRRGGDRRRRVEAGEGRPYLLQGPDRGGPTADRGGPPLSLREDRRCVPLRGSRP